MKKKYNILGIIVSMSIVFGCTDLETELTDSILVESSTGSFSGDPTELLESAYNDLGNFTGYVATAALCQVTADDYIIPTRSTDWGDNGVWRVLHAHTWDASHDEILDSWNQLNSASYTCNQVLASNPSEQQEAESKTLRAFYISYIIDLFGQVPYRDVNQGVDEYPTVMSRSDAFDFIVEDLESSLENLPDGGPSVDNEQVNKALVQTLLAKLYLNKAVYKSENPAGPYTFSAEDMNRVIACCDEVIAAGYSYEDYYFNNFSGLGGKEYILTTSNWWTGIQIYPQIHNSQGGWNGASTLGDFYDKFEANDQRIGYIPTAGLGKGFLIGRQYNDDGTDVLNNAGEPLEYTREILLTGNTDYSGIRVVKYDANDAGNFVFFRISEVKLMKAEAILRGGTPTNDETAQSIVDELRTARGVESINVDLDAILDERGRELYWEGVGHRRTDQIRFETFTNNTWDWKTSTESFRVLFPIPQTAMDTNPNLVQNEGY